jgi:hypothetical protein
MPLLFRQQTPKLGIPAADFSFGRAFGRLRINSRQLCAPEGLETTSPDHNFEQRQ